jgi:hypothetical protein
VTGERPFPARVFRCLHFASCRGVTWVPPGVGRIWARFHGVPGGAWRLSSRISTVNGWRWNFPFGLRKVKPFLAGPKDCGATESPCMKGHLDLVCDLSVDGLVPQDIKTSPLSPRTHRDLGRPNPHPNIFNQQRQTCHTLKPEVSRRWYRRQRR